MNLNSRTELEEERRLFYVALTRAEKKIYLSYVLSRYRWGKPVDSEKSRFIDEINEEFIENNVIQNSISKNFSKRLRRISGSRPASSFSRTGGAATKTCAEFRGAY